MRVSLKWLKKYVELPSDDDYVFMDTEEDTILACKTCIKKFLKENNTTKNELKSDYDNFKLLVFKLRNEYKLSYRKIADELGISKDKIRKVFDN